jgi:uncharacterized protein YndB with AHSA1/START domain
MTAVTCSRTATVTFPTDRQVLITREVDAPRHLVYRAWTTPELVRRWWSGRRGQMTVVEIDLRVGGRWRYVMVGDEGAPAAEALTAVTFTEAAGRTTLAILVQYDRAQDRNAHSDYMQDGLQEALDLLEQTAHEEGRSWER